MQQHPHHFAVAREVRRWYTASTPEIGIHAEDAAFGFLVSSSQPKSRRVVLTVDGTGSVPPAIAAAITHFDGSDFEVLIDDRARAEALSTCLAELGFRPIRDTSVLALVGHIAVAPAPPGLTIEDVFDSEALRRWSEVKLQAFADSEEVPAPERLDAEVEGWRAEWPACRYQLARLEGEPVAVLGHYLGDDQMVFDLATRVPYRHQGIAQTLLAAWSREGKGARSLLINCDDGGRPAALYRRLGFTDEVYWHRRFARETFQ